MKTTITKLSHRDIINFEGNTHHQMTTIRSSVREGEKWSNLLAIRNAKLHNSSLVYSYKDSACISADYVGKKEATEARIKSVQEAPLLSTGDVVEINGTQYSVYVNGSRVSDPVSFKRVDGKCEYTEALKEIDPKIKLDRLENAVYAELKGL